MKNIYFIMALLLSATCFAQDEENQFLISKGVWELTGSFGISLNNLERESEGSLEDRDRVFISVMPNVGYAFSDNWVAGVGLGYSYIESTIQPEDVSDRQDKSHFYAANAFVKRYIPVGSNLAFFLRGQFSYGFEDRTYENADPEIETVNSEATNFGIGINPGLTYFISDDFALQANLGSLAYTNRDETFPDSEQSTQDLRFTLNPNTFNFGLSYFWN